MKYIVDVNNSNPKLLEQNEDGTFTAFAFGHGNDSLPQLKELIRLANAAAGENL